MTLSEPLLDPRHVGEVDRILMGCFVDDLAWGAGVFGGIASSLSDELDPDDPWRHLSARCGGTHRGDPPGECGAWWPGGREFGTWRDATDVIPQVFGEVELDVSLAALATAPLDRPAAAILALAADGVAVTRRAIMEAAGVDGPAVAAAASAAAVRWLTHRHRSTVEDVALSALAPGLVLSWAWRAESGRDDDPDFDPRDLE